MSAPSATIMNKLETLYGQAYTKLNNDLGDSINSANTVKSYINDAKNIVRAGIDKDFSVKYSTDFVAAPLGTGTYSLVIGAGTAFFGKLEEYVPTITIVIGKIDKYGDTLVGDKSAIPFIVSLVDGATYGMTATYRVDTGYQINYNATVPISNLPLPAFADNSVPLYSGIIPSAGIALNTIQDVRPLSYFPPLNDDNIIRNAFNGLDSTENLFIAKSFKSDFQSGVAGLVSAVTNEQSLGFKEYWKSIDYQYTDGFRKLYYDIYGTDLYTKLVSISPTIGGLAPTYSNKMLNGVSNLQFKMESAAAQNTGTTTVDIYGILPSYNRITANLAVSQTGYMKVDAAYSNTVGYVAVKNLDNSFNLMGVTASTNGFLINSHMFNTSGVHNAWDKVYPVELIRTIVPSGTTQNTVFAVGTVGTSYLGVAAVNVASYGSATCRVAVYNK